MDENRIAQWSKSRYLKAGALQVSQNVRTVLVCFQQLICVSKITGHHFPGRVCNPKPRTHAHKQPFPPPCERKQKLDVKKFKINTFIKSISQLIIITSNASLEVPLLRPRSKT